MKNVIKPFLSKAIVLLCLLLSTTSIAQTQPITCFLILTGGGNYCPEECVNAVNQSYSTPGDTTCFSNYYWAMPGSNQGSYFGYQPPCISYPSGGNYTITLYEVDNQGNIQWNNNRTITVFIRYPLSGDFAINPNPACAGEVVGFTVTDTAALVGDSCFWDFGDGNTFIGGLFTTHVYLDSGTYIVTLCITNPCETVCASQTIVIDRASPDFTWTGTCKIKFDSDSTCADFITSHSWNFGDPSSPNNTSTIPDPLHIFTQNNVWFTVTHTIVTTIATYTYTAQVLQTGDPVAAISGWQTNNCGNGYLTYTAAPCDSGIIYTWSINGVTTAADTGCQFNVNWGASGGYVSLSAWDQIGDCYGYDTLWIPACCDWVATPYRIDNTTASDVLTGSTFAGCVTGNIVDGNCIGISHIVISGVFTINVPIVFQNCELIDMNANTPILINSGQSLTFDNCVVSNKCDTMWDGIYIPDPSATLYIINGSKVQFAKHAVVSNDGGNYFIENSTLQNNDTDMVVNTFNGTHTGIVRGTNFTMFGPMLPALPALPLGHTETVCAIEIRSNANITIGDPSLAVYRNNFTNILVGVRSSNSITKVVNARFQNLNPTFQQSFIPNAGTGVVAIGKKNALYQPSITVGGIGLRQCIFVDLQTAVDASERINVDVQKNSIAKIRRYGVRVRNSLNTQITINSNSINNQGAAGYGFITGIHVLECYGANVNINTNTILQSMAVPNQNGTGIRVELVTPGDITANIVGNNIERAKIGIHVRNLVGKNKVFITNNTVKFQKQNAQFTSTHIGVHVEKCQTVKVRYNTVYKSSNLNPTSANQPFLIGVRITDSPLSIVSHNTLTKMGTGIYGWDLCNNSSLACNFLDRCFNGFFFSGSSGSCNIGDQVVDQNNSPAPTGNTWNPLSAIGSSDIAGTIFPTVDWYRDGSYIPILSGLNTGSITNDATTPSGDTSACLLPQFLSPAPVVEREQNAGQAVLNPGAFASGTEQSYQGRRDAHRKLRETPIWMVLGTPQDSLFAGFYVGNDNVNIGLFRNFEDMAAVDSINMAGNILNSITDTNLSETNLKVVYSIYHQSWMQGIYEFTSADSATLHAIAVQHASDAGDAVYAARVMLALDVDEVGGSGNRFSDPEHPDDESLQVMSLYPNPASNQVNVNTKLNDGEIGVVRVTDLQGKIVLLQHVTASGIVILDISGLDNGMYFVQMLVNGELIETNKLEVIHE